MEFYTEDRESLRLILNAAHEAHRIGGGILIDGDSEGYSVEVITSNGTALPSHPIVRTEV